MSICLFGKLHGWLPISVLVAFVMYVYCALCMQPVSRTDDTSAPLIHTCMHECSVHPDAHT